tara:strand:- start:2144 stop:3673 length:1530 start_codon:yes stop_codon:yes gene_type:complete
MTLTQQQIIEGENFLEELHEKFNSQIEFLIEERKKYYEAFDNGFFPDFSQGDNSIKIRTGDWKAAPCPSELLDRRVEITGPPKRKLIINALNSGANVFMADFEDSHSPLYSNSLEGHLNLYDAVRKTIDYTDSNNGKKYKLNNQTAVLFVRPRGLHLQENNFCVGKESIRASLFDFGLFFIHNYEELIKRNTAPYFYLPKLEHSLEARLWADVFKFSEQRFNLPPGTIKATVLIETIPAVFQMDEIIYELKEHSVGLNCGRWDYIFNFIKCFKTNESFILPDRSKIDMSSHFMKSYSQLLIETCHRRGVHAMGGMSAQIPIKDNVEANTRAMEKVKQDKIVEVQAGHDGSWVAHPGLVTMVKKIFDEHMVTPNQINYNPILTRSISADDLLLPPVGTCSDKMLRNNINILFQYTHSWLEGNGCLALNNLMEDIATAEISRVQIWQWLYHKVMLDNNIICDKEYFKEVWAEELTKYKNYSRYEDTQKILWEMCVNENLVDFLTLHCYNLL